MDTTTITLEQLEALATQLEGEDEATRAKMLRLIRAYARILSLREPEVFGRRRATELRDQDGHWDRSYPPEQVYRNRTGPRLIEIREHATTDIATEGGFYHAWRRVTEDQGLYVDRAGMLWGCNETGTGAVGQFAAHPGDCGVEVELDWSPLALSDVSTADLRTAEEQLRRSAFPAATRVREETQQ